MILHRFFLQMDDNHSYACDLVSSGLINKIFQSDRRDANTFVGIELVQNHDYVQEKICPQISGEGHSPDLPI